MSLETESYKLDERDEDILRALQENARLTNKELAAKVHLSTTPTYERVRRLERLGFIKQYATILDAAKLNKGFAVFCSIKLRRLNSEMAKEFTEMVKQIPEVTECYNISASTICSVFSLLICSITRNSCSMSLVATKTSLLSRVRLSWKR